MLFSSLVFISIFLPLVLLMYYCVPRSWKNTILLAASLLFYAWGEMVLVWVMILSILWNYLGALLISGGKTPRQKKFCLMIGIAVNLSLLIYFKYMNFFIENLNMLFHSGIGSIHIVMPIGISFYTFQSISYLVDVYRQNTSAEKSLLNVGLYISFFPQLIAGPIVKFHEISEQINRRQESMERFACGMQRFIEGLAKKVLIANVMGETADTVFSCDISILTFQDAWVGALAYAMQIFFDFSGYSDMAIGLGHMFGFTIPENFNYPYTAKTITEFWRRWHISLSTWFKEYLYIPLGGSRNGMAETLRNLLIVFFVTGLWHGAGWTFIIWGLWHGLFIIMERISGVDKYNFPGPVKIIQHIYLLLTVLIGWVFFRADNFNQAWIMIRKMFSCPWQNAENPLPVSGLFIVMFLCALFFSSLLPQKLCHFFREKYSFLIGRRICCCVLLFLVMLRLAGASYNPFIYFRF